MSHVERPRKNPYLDSVDKFCTRHHAYTATPRGIKDLGEVLGCRKTYPGSRWRADSYLRIQRPLAKVPLQCHDTPYGKVLATRVVAEALVNGRVLGGCFLQQHSSGCLG